MTRARIAVARAARRAGMPDDRVDDLVVAVSEAVTNALEAHVRAGSHAPIEVACQSDGSTFEVAIRDRGHGFEPDLLVPRPPVDDPRHLDVERGWGIQLMRQLVDEVVFDAARPGTCARLRMTIPR